MKHMPRVLASVVFALVSIAVNAQTHPGSAPRVHPIPTAPKEFVPASFSALPGLECKLYPQGAPSKSLTVSTDDDGYARFHAMRATASDPVQLLALDCINSAGKSYSYLVDLTADDTFAPRPLNLENERGIDRPALTGDPLSYSQSELIEAGYGLRPDPTDSAAYARWLAAASLPGRMLEPKRSYSRAERNNVVPDTVVKETAPWWVGSVLTGAPSYVSTEATFNVPTAVGGGDETTGTEIAIWNGLGGFGTGSGLIQGGVNIQTIGTAALYWSWREYCCGDGDSNGYGGAFTPEPGDKIYSEEWYCDAKGNLNLNGGYGCTLLHDTTSGAILSCTLAKGKPCWSVKAIKGMTLGKAAEFIIEDQSPQCCGKSDTAFTDFTPEVTMSGSAYSTTTRTYSQTVTSDPLVDLLEDFTNTTSHMNISLGTTDETYFSSSQFKQVYGHADYAANAESIAVGPNAEGSPVGDAWMLGEHPDSNGDYSIYQWKSSKWVKQPGAATHIAISPQGYPWVVNHLGEIYYWDGSAFNPAPGNACASWIGVGPNAYGSTYGDPWILGCHEGTNGYAVYQLQGSSWVHGAGWSATKLAVGPLGPWIIGTTGAVSYWDGAGFVAAPTACATSIAVGPISAPFAGPYGDVWITGCSLRGNGYRIYQLQHGSSWVEIPGIAAQISVSPDFGVPWIVDTEGNIFE